MQDNQDKEVRMKYEQSTRGYRKKILAGARRFSRHQNVRTGSWAHPAFIQLGFRGFKAAGARSLPLKST